MMFKQSFS